MSQAPEFNVNDVVYLRESAALGHIEAVKISGILKSAGQWLYTVHSRAVPQRTHYGDRVSLSHGQMMYFSASEFTTLCEALDLAEANARRILEKVQAQRATLCE